MAFTGRFRCTCRGFLVSACDLSEHLGRRLGRDVAGKQLRTDLASDSTCPARFRREAQAAQFTDAGLERWAT